MTQFAPILTNRGDITLRMNVHVTPIIEQVTYGSPTSGMNLIFRLSTSALF